MFWNYLTFKELAVKGLTIDSTFCEIGEEFFDVSLCCDNGTDIVPAHKVILAACSPLFRKILSRQKNQQNPFLYLKGIHLKEMKAVVNFMYYGEVNCDEDNLQHFLPVAQGQIISKQNCDSLKFSKKATKLMQGFLP